MSICYCVKILFISRVTRWFREFLLAFYGKGVYNRINLKKEGAYVVSQSLFKVIAEKTYPNR